VEVLRGLQHVAVVRVDLLEAMLLGAGQMERITGSDENRAQDGRHLSASDVMLSDVPLEDRCKLQSRQLTRCEAGRAHVRSIGPWPRARGCVGRARVAG